MIFYLILTLGAGLRIYGLNSLSFWHDEALFATFSQNLGWGEMISQVTTSIHPPLYFILLKIWGQVFGNSEIALRSMSLVVGMMTIWLGYYLIKELLRDHPNELIKTSLATALFLAVNPVLIQASMQVTSFALASFTIVLATILMLKAVRTHSWIFWLGYALSITAAIYTNYLSFFPLVIHLFYILYLVYIRHLRPLYPAAAWVLATIAFAPWVPILLQQLKANPLSLIAPSINTPLLLLIPGFLAVIVILYIFSRNFSGPAKWLIIGLSIVPYLILSEPYLSLILAVVILSVPWVRTRRLGIILFVILSLSIYIWESGTQTPTNNPGMRGAAGFINERITESDKVLLGSRFVNHSFHYYHQADIKPLLALNQKTLDQIKPQTNDTIWLVWTTGFDESKPNVPGNWKVVEETKFTDTPEFKGDIIVTQYLVE